METTALFAEMVRSIECQIKSSRNRERDYPDIHRLLEEKEKIKKAGFRDEEMPASAVITYIYSPPL